MTDVVESGNKTLVVKDNDHHGHHYGRGLEGKDAAFLSGHFNSNANQAIIDAIRDEGRWGVSTAKDNQTAMERMVGVTRLQTVESENRLANMIKEESNRTRELIQANEQARLRDENLVLKMKSTV